MAGVGLYWRFEKWLRRTESRLDSMVSVIGCIAAVRRELLATLPAGTILDDVYSPLAVAMAGHWVVHDERFKAFDRLPERTRDEFRRKVRTLACNCLELVLSACLLGHVHRYGGILGNGVYCLWSTLFPLTRCNSQRVGAMS